MVSNQILKAIKERRSIIRYKPLPIPDDHLEAVLEAGIWAPSWVNVQPWNFIVVKDTVKKKKLTEIATTILNRGIEEAAAIIVVCADTSKDPHHYIEDAAAATQNMSLAAYSLGYGSYWIGVLDIKNEKGSSEQKIRELLKIPGNHRVVSMLPIGIPAESPEKKRKQLSEIVFKDEFNKK